MLAKIKCDITVYSNRRYTIGYQEGEVCQVISGPDMDGDYAVWTTDMSDWNYINGEDLEIMAEPAADQMFLYTIYWGHGNWEYGLVKSPSLGAAELYLRQKYVGDSVGTTITVEAVSELEFKDGIHTIYEVG